MGERIDSIDICIHTYIQVLHICTAQRKNKGESYLDYNNKRIGGQVESSKWMLRTTYIKMYLRERTERGEAQHNVSPIYFDSKYQTQRWAPKNILFGLLSDFGIVAEIPRASVANVTHVVPLVRRSVAQVHDHTVEIIENWGPGAQRQVRAKKKKKPIREQQRRVAKLGLNIGNEIGRHILRKRKQ